MRTSHDRPKRRLRWLIAGLAVAAVLSGAGFGREVLRARQIDKEISALKAEADSQRVRNFQVSELASSLDNGEYLEREARVKLGLQKTGEQVVVLKKNAAAGTPQASPEGLVPRSLGAGGWSNPKKWLVSFVDPKAFEAYVRSGNVPADTAAAR